MKKIFISKWLSVFIFVVIISIVLSIYFRNNKLVIIVENKEDKIHMICENSEYKVYSNYTNNVITKGNKNICEQNVLKKTFSRKDVVTAFNDGGTVLLKYKTNNDIEAYILLCHRLSDYGFNEDIYILSNDDIMNDEGRIRYCG